MPKIQSGAREPLVAGRRDRGLTALGELSVERPTRSQRAPAEWRPPRQE